MASDTTPDVAEADFVYLVLEADYSTALSLLLRYPQPSTSPSAFVKDALYLQKNLTLEGGHDIVFKYSRKRILLDQTADVGSSASVKPHGVFVPQSTLSSPPENPNAKQGKSDTRISLPMPSPARFFQELGGVEGIIKGAIGELKQNVRSLQAGSPPRQIMRVRQPFSQDVNPVSPNMSQITSRIDFLEARNKSLATMLEESLKGLWDHQRVVAEDRTKVDVDALSLAIAKVQFVQVYLEDSTMPLHGDMSHPANNPDKVGEHGQPSTSATSEVTGDKNASKLASKSRRGSKAEKIDLTSSNVAQPGLDSAAPAHGMSLATTTEPSPFHRPRPSLAQSSFSWMLGEDHRRSSFIAASPLPPERSRKTHAREKVGYLFGDDKPPDANDPGVNRSEDLDLEGFTLGTLKG